MLRVKETQSVRFGWPQVENIKIQDVTPHPAFSLQARQSGSQSAEFQLVRCQTNTLRDILSGVADNGK